MTTARVIIFFTFLLLTQTVFSQGKDERTFLGKAYAEAELKSILSGNAQHNNIDKKTLIIKDNMTAIGVTEPILFSFYGKDNITSQRPYETFLIDNHWIINGTLPRERRGGRFLIILDARDGRILRMTHGK